MYIPPLNKVEDLSEILGFINRYNFASVVSYDGTRPIISHIPIEPELKEGKVWLRGHLAKANFQWQSFRSDQDILVSFMEAHTYISPSWYDYAEVPTWNYIAVHMYGKPRIFEGEELLTFVKYQMNKYEAGVSYPRSPAGIDEKYLMRQLRGIIGFEIVVSDIQAKYKLSQNKSDKNIQSVITELEKSKDQNAQKIAKAMNKLKKP
jgi:transcriptional regulator